MRLWQRIDKIKGSNLGRDLGGKCNPDYFPHIPRTLDGAIRLQLELHVKRLLKEETPQLVSEIREASNAELLKLLGFPRGDDDLPYFCWWDQNWIALLCHNLGVEHNGGEYGGDRNDKPFVEGPPIYFPRYVIYYDEGFRHDPDKARRCGYDISKSANTLIREWWESEKGAKFIKLKDLWLSHNAAWLSEHAG